MYYFTRLLIFTFLVLTFRPVVFSQQEQEKNSDGNLYAQALLASIEKMKSSWGQQTDVITERVLVSYDQIIVERSLEITDDLSTKMGNAQIEYLDPQGLIERFKKLKKEFLILRSHPMKTDGKRLRISFTTHWISYKKRSLIYSLSDWSHVYFRFDCQQEKYIIDEVRLGGI